jgi:hypothetical protein
MLAPSLYPLLGAYFKVLHIRMFKTYLSQSFGNIGYHIVLEEGSMDHASLQEASLPTRQRRKEAKNS